jgi:arginine decarboxylase
MRIYLTTGTGEGPTPLAAFDAALLNAGVANYNLICLSSVIPAGGEIHRAKYLPSGDEYGHRLYVVMSRHEEQRRGETAWAGVGWTQDENSGRGLFVELHGSDRDRLEADIRITLESMVASRPLAYGPIESEIAGIECRERPVCALVIAVYQSQGWNG